MTTVSWKAIGHNWDVCSADGEPVGRVFLVVGDGDADIFDGLAITHEGHAFVWHNSAARPHPAPADQVASIDEGRVTLTLTAEEARALPPHDVPASARIEPQSASRMERLETWFRGKTGQDRTE